MPLQDEKPVLPDNIDSQQTKDSLVEAKLKLQAEAQKYLAEVLKQAEKKDFQQIICHLANLDITTLENRKNILYPLLKKYLTEFHQNKIIAETITGVDQNQQVSLLDERSKAVAKLIELLCEVSYGEVAHYCLDLLNSLTNKQLESLSKPVKADSKSPLDFGPLLTKYRTLAMPVCLNNLNFLRHALSGHHIFAFLVEFQDDAEFDLISHYMTGEADRRSLKPIHKLVGVLANYYLVPENFAALHLNQKKLITQLWEDPSYQKMLSLPAGYLSALQRLNDPFANRILNACAGIRIKKEIANVRLSWREVFNNLLSRDETRVRKYTLQVHANKDADPATKFVAGQMYAKVKLQKLPKVVDMATFANLILAKEQDPKKRRFFATQINRNNLIIEPGVGRIEEVETLVNWLPSVENNRPFVARLQDQVLQEDNFDTLQKLITVWIQEESTVDPENLSNVQKFILTVLCPKYDTAVQSKVEVKEDEVSPSNKPLSKPDKIFQRLQFFNKEPSIPEGLLRAMHVFYSKKGEKYSNIAQKYLECVPSHFVTPVKSKQSKDVGSASSRSALDASFAPSSCGKMRQFLDDQEVKQVQNPDGGTPASHVTGSDIADQRPRVSLGALNFARGTLLTDQPRDSQQENMRSPRSIASQGVSTSKVSTFKAVSPPRDTREELTSDSPKSLPSQSANG